MVGRRVLLTVLAVVWAAGGCGETPTAQLPVEDYACSTDGDCCVILNPCRTGLVVVTAKNREQLARAYQVMRPMDCNACVPRPVEVSCVAGRCEGRAAPSSNDLRLTDAHCGSLLPGNPDAATSVVSATPCEAPAQF